MLVYVCIHMNSGTNSFCTGIEFGIFFEIIIDIIATCFGCIHDFIYFLVFHSDI